MIDFLTWWLIGWGIMSVLLITYDVFIDKYRIKSKKLIVYESIKNGIFSWIGLIIILCFGIAYLGALADEYLTKKLS